MTKHIICPNCKGKGYNTVMTGIRGDYCGVMNETCPQCNGTGLNLADATNADLIRAMSDEELAKMLYMFGDLDERIHFCPSLPECDALLDTEDGIPQEKCMGCLLAWLRQPVEQDLG